MSDHFELITTLVTAFGLALVFGYLAERFLKTPALVGYIIAGVAVSLLPGLPAVDQGMTEQFAEIGVMLLMFGVGLHFSVNDLLRVKAVSGTGAVIQMTVSTLGGCLLAMLGWDWSLPRALVFGLTLSCASTVVVMKALELRHLTTSINGQVVIGWLVVQDLVTVFIMVCLPLLAQVVNGAEMSTEAIVKEFSKTFLSVIVFVAAMLIVGRRVLPWILKKVADLGSRELFTLCVLALAIGIAYGASALFSVSYALGAFFAGMVMRESSLPHRAAQNSLPLQDAFAVLFFVSVGLLLDWHVFIEHPFSILTILLVILLITSVVSGLLVLVLGWPLDTALVLGACVAQIGEFSFILCGQGMSLGLADHTTMSLIVAASIVSIAANPLLFAVKPRVRHRLVGRFPYMRRAAMREAPIKIAQTQESNPAPATGHVIVAGYNSLAQSLLTSFQQAKIPTVCVLNSANDAPKPEEGVSVPMLVIGDAKDPMTMVKARIMSATFMVLPLKDAILNRQIVKYVRQLRQDLPILVRLPDDDAPSDWTTDANLYLLTNNEALLLAMKSVLGSVYPALNPFVPTPEHATTDEEGAAQITQDYSSLAVEEHTAETLQSEEADPASESADKKWRFWSRLTRKPTAVAAIEKTHAEQPSKTHWWKKVHLRVPFHLRDRNK